MLVTAGKSRPRAATSVQQSTPSAQRENARKVRMRSACPQPASSASAQQAATCREAPLPMQATRAMRVTDAKGVHANELLTGSRLQDKQMEALSGRVPAACCRAA